MATDLNIRGDLSGKNLFSRHGNHNWNAIPLRVIDNATSPKAKTTPSGIKYIPMGTIVGDPAALDTNNTPLVTIDPADAGRKKAVGILIHDAYIEPSINEANCGVVREGFINIGALPDGNPPDAIKDELPNITFEYIGE